MAEGRLTSVVDRKYALSEVPAALGYIEQGHARGKVLIDLMPGCTIRDGALVNSASAARRP